MQALAVIGLTQPGPKMIWQFGELGYDISIDNPCRVCNKPILWNYLSVSRRKQTYDVYAAVLNLRKNYETFKTLDFTHSLSGSVKRLILNNPDMNAVVMANFAVTASTGIPSFQHTGWWYEYFTGDSMNVTSVTASLSFEPGEYRIYTDVRLDKPTITESTASLEELEAEAFPINLYPNPATDLVNLAFESKSSEPYELLIINEAGQVVLTKKGTTAKGTNNLEVTVGSIKNGAYHALLKVGKSYTNKAFIIGN
jgi:hypothetical protein